MAKSVYAVTNIKVSGDKTYEAGEEIKASELKEYNITKEQVKELFDAGAIEIREDEETKEEATQLPSGPMTPDGPGIADKPDGITDGVPTFKDDDDDRPTDKPNE